MAPNPPSPSSSPAEAAAAEATAAARLEALERTAGFTCRYTAGLRHVESTQCGPIPVVHDLLAVHLAGDRGLQLAQQELDGLVAAQGPGKHLRVPARSRLMDDVICKEVEQRGIRQVVSLGAGMCTRPWRLGCLAACDLAAEVDLPAVVQLKQLLLRQAGAQLVHGGAAGGEQAHRGTQLVHGGEGEEAQAAEGRTCDEGGGVGARGEGSSGSAAGPSAAHSPAAEQEQQPAACAFPLLSKRYAALGVDLSTCPPGSLRQQLERLGWDASRPTLWVLEALIYYLPLAAAEKLLVELADSSAQGSRLAATCVDAELLEASRSGVPSGHVFKDLWFFDTAQLLYGGGDAFSRRWRVDPEDLFVGDEEGPGAPAAAGEGSRDGQGAAAGGTAGGDVQPHSAAAPAGADGGCGAQQAAAAGGRALPLPKSTRQLARERLGADTYVALYGGSELLFCAGLRD